MGFRGLLFLIFLSVPLIEIYLLIEIGGVIGAPATVFLVVFTAVLGALLLRQQGFYTLQNVQQQMSRGEMPAMAMLEGVCLVIGGVLLLTPGFLTDSIGFLLLIGPTRRFLIRKFVPGISMFSSSGYVGTRSQKEPDHKKRRTTHHKPTIIDGEYRREDDD
ncbi:MAG: FxsA family protein [Gammaproteobacteria bacterium]|nr:FxsA family protein [Gammaproteobacteria bacterium]